MLQIIATVLRSIVASIVADRIVISSNRKHDPHDGNKLNQNAGGRRRSCKSSNNYHHNNRSNTYVHTINFNRSYYSCRSSTCSPYMLSNIALSIAPIQC